MGKKKRAKVGEYYAIIEAMESEEMEKRLDGVKINVFHPCTNDKSIYICTWKVRDINLFFKSYRKTRY